MISCFKENACGALWKTAMKEVKGSEDILPVFASRVMITSVAYGSLLLIGKIFSVTCYQLGYQSLVNRIAMLSFMANPSTVAAITIGISALSVLFQFVKSYPTTIKTPLKASSKGPAEIFVGTYNILFPQPDVDPRNPPESLKDHKFEKIGYSYCDMKKQIYDNSIYRANIVAQNILNSNLDAVCLEEVTYESIEILKGKLPDYEFVWDTHVKRSSQDVKARNEQNDNKLPTTYHGVAILYKKTAAKLIDQKVQRCHLGHGRCRVHVMADLDIKGKYVRIVAGHFTDPRWFKPKQMPVDKEVKIALKLASEESDYVFDATIIAGDMNQDQWGDCDQMQSTADFKHATMFQPLIKEGYTVDGNYDATEFDKDFDILEAVTNPFLYNETPTLLKGNRKIDWIWGFADDCKLEPIDLSHCRETASDHYIVGSKFKWQ